jgi:hypothetical protein
MDESARSSGIRRKRSIAVFIAGILLVAAFWVVLTYNSSDSGATKAMETSTNTSSQATATNTTETSSQGMSLLASDYNSSLGLVLTLSISNSTIPQDDGISLHIALNNTLATQNNLLPLKNDSSSIWQPSWNLQPCSTFPIGVEMFQGNYALGNLSKGEPLSFVVPTGYNCADHPPSAISFAPLSGNITSPADWFLNQSAWSTEYRGYWTGSAVPPSSDAAFHSFEPGIYTLVGEDWWGQVAALHFEVIENQNPLECATIASNPSFAAYTSGSAGAGPLRLEAYYQNTRVNNTVVLALSNTGNSTLEVTSFDTGSFYFGSTPYQFSPGGGQVQRWQYYAPNGTLSYPAFFYPNQCVLMSLTLSMPFPQPPLTLGFTNGETQTFAFKP